MICPQPVGRISEAQSAGTAPLKLAFFAALVYCVIPAQAGIQYPGAFEMNSGVAAYWIPAYAGMTSVCFVTQ